MKEMTLEELIEDNFRNDTLIVQMKVIAVMQQVREATIAECSEQCEPTDQDTKSRIEVLPTDLIKIIEK